jgi:hypothetical protein
VPNYHTYVYRDGNERLRRSQRPRQLSGFEDRCLRADMEDAGANSIRPIRGRPLGSGHKSAGFLLGLADVIGYTHKKGKVEHI